MSHGSLPPARHGLQPLHAAGLRPPGATTARHAIGGAGSGARISLAAIAAVVVGACAPDASAAQFGVATQFTDEPPCVVFPRPVPAGTPITLEGVAPRRTVRARVLRGTTACAGNYSVEGPAYVVEVPRGVSGLGVVTATTGLRSRDLVFRSCGSNEGVHLTVWQHARRLWHEYYHVPYDTEPTCTDEETRPAGDSARRPGSWRN